MTRSVEAYRIDGVGDATDPYGNDALFPVEQLIGREAELDQLVERWQAACNGRGSTVRLVGEPGVGKSTIVAALRSHVARDASGSECFAHYASSRQRIHGSAGHLSDLGIPGPP